MRNIYCVEIIIRKNKHIEGVKVDNTESKIVQYADDRELTLAGYKLSLKSH